ncbi:MAG: YggS family pyridoxal phosphate-dependent enzyme [Clostridiales bacterium]|nr:YggS family pyridoxal phosphate-dependent enzyme [Clostridiales bacterium]
MSAIAENVAFLRERIERAAAAAGRAPGSVAFVAATKMNGADNVRAAIAAGVDACGENRVQELLEKYEQSAYTGAPLHFIGGLQKNKVKYLVGKVELIQSVDSRELALTIAKKAQQLGITQNVLIEVNIGREEAKSGVDPDAADELIAELSGLEGIRVKGLMAIPPNIELDPKNSVYFEKMRNLYVDMRTKKYDNVNVEILSMGMSGDFETAIACGSNMVRIGSAIFGPRIYR